MVRYCPKCEIVFEKASLGWNFCPTCGRKLPVYEDPRNQQKLDQYRWKHEQERMEKILNTTKERTYRDQQTFTETTFDT